MTVTMLDAGGNELEMNIVEGSHLYRNQEGTEALFHEWDELPKSLRDNLSGTVESIRKSMQEAQALLDQVDSPVEAPGVAA